MTENGNNVNATNIKWLEREISQISLSIASINTKIDSWPKDCETYRGNIHERINKFYLWTIGIFGSALLLLAGALIKGMAQ